MKRLYKMLQWGPWLHNHEEGAKVGEPNYCVMYDKHGKVLAQKHIRKHEEVLFFGRFKRVRGMHRKRDFMRDNAEAGRTEPARFGQEPGCDRVKWKRLNMTSCPQCGRECCRQCRFFVGERKVCALCFKKHCDKLERLAHNRSALINARVEALPARFCQESGREGVRDA